MIAPKDLVRHELIGLEVKILDSTNLSQIGLSGRVVDETRQTLSLETDKGVKSFAKDLCVFLFYLPGGESVRVEGRLLVSRPEDRIKKKLKSW
jgi:ribonuclease P protein subunit POP4